MVHSIRAYTDHEARAIAKDSFLQALAWTPAGCRWPRVTDLPPAMQSGASFTPLRQLAAFLDGAGE